MIYNWSKYRRKQNNLDKSEYNYMVNLENRKEDVKRLIDEKGMLTEELVKAINEAGKLSDVEDIYAPFKEKLKVRKQLSQGQSLQLK